MTVYYRDEIEANRLKWVKFLDDSKRKKVTGILESAEDRGARCCLGHGAYCLGLKRKVHVDKTFDGHVFGKTVYFGEEGDQDSEMAPNELVEKLGLWANDGDLPSARVVYDNEKGRVCSIMDDNEKWDDVPSYDSLADLNDSTDATPKQIAKYLKTVIAGGENTPFKPLTDYPERPAVDEGK